MYNSSITHQINHSLVFIDSGADQSYPIENSEEGELWDQGNIQLASPLTSQCCNTLVIEHKNELYCSGCGQNLETHEPSTEVTNLITH